MTGLLCTDCDANIADLGEAFMLHDDVWNAVASREDMLCVGCFERRLGRTLAPVDFTEAPLNATRLEDLPDAVRHLADVLLHKSSRLRARLEGRGDARLGEESTS